MFWRTIVRITSTAFSLQAVDTCSFKTNFWAIFSARRDMFQAFNNQILSTKTFDKSFGSSNFSLNSASLFLVSFDSDKKLWLSLKPDDPKHWLETLNFLSFEKNFASKRVQFYQRVSNGVELQGAKVRLIMSVRATEIWRLLLFSIML